MSQRSPACRDPTGVSIVACDGPRLGRRDPRRAHAARGSFNHVLTDLTVAVHPQAQGRGVGSRLFAALFEAAARLTPPATRIELVARTGNAAAIRLYERLGFRAEGRFVGRVRLPDGSIEDDIPMARITDAGAGLSVTGAARPSSSTAGVRQPLLTPQ